MEIFHGRSEIDDQSIFAVVTESENVKTGSMKQIWILNASVNPLEAIDKGIDSSICGDCKHRGVSCYVAVFQAPLGIYRAWKRGSYEKANNFDFLINQNVRFGAYGDPAALPFDLVEEIALKAKGYTGYTHQWKLPYVQKYQKYLMASVDSVEEYNQAKAMGWRTFRVKTAHEEKLTKEITCPASIEAGKKSTCEQCKLCSGLNSNCTKDIVINVHGLPYKQANFGRMSLNLVA